MTTSVVTLMGGPCDGVEVEVEGRPATVAVPAVYKGVPVAHRYTKLTHRLQARVIRYRYGETVVVDPAVANTKWRPSS